MRIRTVKPEFWRSPDICSLSLNTRLLFIGLWNYVDDNGVGEDEVSLIRSDLFPRDDPQEMDKVIQRGLAELSARGLIARYATPANGRKYLYVTNWAHQRIDKPTQSKKPLPTSDNAVLADDSRNILGILNEDSRLYQGNKGPREGDQGSKVAGDSKGGQLVPVADATATVDKAPTSSSPSKRGSRLPDNYKPSQATIDAIKAEFPNATSADLTREHNQFVDWATSCSSKAAVKRDWDAAWRNWMRRELVKIPGAAPNGNLRGAAAKAMEFQRIGEAMMLDGDR